VIKRDRLREFVLFANGDPRLSAWEAGFANSMGYLANADHGPSLSEKQQAALLKIWDKLGFSLDTPPLPLEEDVDVDGYPIGDFDGLLVAEGETTVSDADYEE